jgi:DNA mismatch repair protein MLH3
LPLFANQASDDRGYALTHSSYCARDFGAPGQSSSEHARTRFHKGDLSKAQVINQVDRKFIACLVDLDQGHGKPPKQLAAGGSTLILIDQHAADERVRVERFLTEICSGFLRHCEGTGGVEVSELSPAVPILLTRHEASRLATIEEIQSAFDRWGVRFEGLAKLTSLKPESAGDETSDGYVQVFVRAIPAIVGDKVRVDICMVLRAHYPVVQLLMNDELRDLVKGYLGTLESEGAYPPNLSQQKDADNVKDDESRWLKALRWCPQELLDLINSKACRGTNIEVLSIHFYSLLDHSGAVMFNDPLSLEQCERLVGHLAATAFPFQCAHGRLVSLIDLNLRLFISALLLDLP